MSASHSKQFKGITNVRLAYYKAPGTWVDALIRCWTRSKYSHVEFYYENNGRCFIASSSQRDKGVRGKMLNKPLCEDKWDFQNVALLTQGGKRLRLFAPESGKRYDLMGIALSQVFSFEIHHPRRWFCSEICGYVLGIKKPHTLNPGQLYQRVEAMLNEVAL